MRVPIYGFDTSIPLRNNRGARGGAMAGRMALQLSGHAQVQVRLKTNCGIVFVGFASPALGGHLWRGLDGECEPPDRIRLRCRGAPPKNSNVSAIRPQSERPGPGGPPPFVPRLGPVAPRSWDAPELALRDSCEPAVRHLGIRTGNPCLE